MRMRVSVYLLPILVGSLTLTSCGAPEPGITDLWRERNIAESTAVDDFYPADRAENVDPALPITVRFSSPINPNSVDLFTFRVEDEGGNPLEGYFHFSDDYTFASFIPTISGYRSALPTNSVLRVLLRYLETENLQRIPKYHFEFTTNNFTEITGNFRVVDVEPDREWIRRNEPIVVEFSSPVFPGTGFCDPDYYSGAFQVFVVDPFTMESTTEIYGPSIHTCLQCNEINGACDRIAIYKSGGWPQFTLLSLRLRGNHPNLKSLGGEPLSSSSQRDQLVIKFVAF